MLWALLSLAIAQPAQVVTDGATVELFVGEQKLVTVEGKLARITGSSFVDFKTVGRNEVLVVGGVAGTGSVLFFLENGDRIGLKVIVRVRPVDAGTPPPNVWARRIEGRKDALVGRRKMGGPFVSAFSVWGEQVLSLSAGDTVAMDPFVRFAPSWVVSVLACGRGVTPAWSALKPAVPGDVFDLIPESERVTALSNKGVFTLTRGSAKWSMVAPFPPHPVAAPLPPELRAVEGRLLVNNGLSQWWLATTHGAVLLPIEVPRETPGETVAANPSGLFRAVKPVGGGWQLKHVAPTGVTTVLRRDSLEQRPWPVFIGPYLAMTSGKRMAEKRDGGPAAIDSVLSISRDEGHTWTDGQVPGDGEIRLGTWTGDELFVIVEGRLFRSTDGRVWSTVPLSGLTGRISGLARCGEELLLEVESDGAVFAAGLASLRAEPGADPGR